MKNKRLKPRAWHLAFYRHSYGLESWEFPHNLCPYTWKTVSAFGLLPLTAPGNILQLVTRTSHSLSEKGGVGALFWVANLFVALLGGASIMVITGAADMYATVFHAWVAGLCGVGILGGSLVAVHSTLSLLDMWRTYRWEIKAGNAIEKHGLNPHYIPPQPTSLTKKAVKATGYAAIDTWDLIAAYWNAFMDNNCPRIEWEKDDA
jgi:hypothetical protein